MVTLKEVGILAKHPEGTQGAGKITVSHTDTDITEWYLNPDLEGTPRFHINWLCLFPLTGKHMFSVEPAQLLWIGCYFCKKWEGGGKNFIFLFSWEAINIHPQKAMGSHLHAWYMKANCTSVNWSISQCTAWVPRWPPGSSRSGI